MKLIWRALCFTLLLVLALPGHGADRTQPELIVFAAASLTDVMTEIGADYTRNTGQEAKFSFAASSVLARQIEAGAHADLFISADTEWMDYLQTRKLIDPDTRADVARNRLVLIAPADSRIQLKIAPHFPLAAALGSGRLATGDPDSVPVGRYAHAALGNLGVWDEIADRLVRADNVRSALAYVARAEVPLGIVYETDALIEKRVRIVDIFPAGSHPPITYPAAVTETARRGAKHFAAFLRGPTAREIFIRQGFQSPDR